MLRRINLDYSPLDFFSGNEPRMTQAVRSLLQNPQNFCLLFVRGSPVYGRAHEDSTAARGAVSSLLSLGIPSRDAFDALASVLAQLLSQEPLLARLWAMQAMDALDVEGAALVFRRLAALCGGDEAAALARLAAAELEPLAGAVDRLAELEEAVAREASRSLGSDARGAGGDGDGDGDGAGDGDAARHEQARAAVKALSEEDCMLLLRRWLVSLGACDASLMISLRQCRPEEGSSEPEGSGPSHLQTAATAGAIRWAAVEGGDSPIHLAYSLRVVDVGPKPPTKVLAKAALEEQILAMAAQHLEATSQRGEM